MNPPAARLSCYNFPFCRLAPARFGPDEVLFDFNACDPAHYGLVPRATIALFEGVNSRTADSTFIVQCSYLEVYNDRLN